MVDVITPTTEFFSLGRKNCMLLTFSGVDGAGEYGIFDSWTEDMDWVPRTAVCLVDTGGGTNAIDVDIDVSMDGTTYVASDINNITATATHTYHPAAGAADDSNKIRWRYWKMTAVDEGSGHTNEVYLWLFE